ncbi:Gene 88 protein [uncultured Caudovirales phage]|uniref:Gene 88 protein n=1 Tax=uncultured Caudovirales phage TaxID=2100421 RepID=A0A6J5TA47_9CAUD|nr:Gene 88 protein [uncultured Caudovirales phage]
MNIYEVAGVGKLHGLTVQSLDSFVKGVDPEETVDEASLASMRDFFGKEDPNTVDAKGAYTTPKFGNPNPNVPTEIQNIVNKMYRMGRVTPEEYKQLQLYKAGKYTKEAVEGRSKHKVAVTVSEPDHSAVTKRKELKQRMCTVTADHREQACDTAVNWYKKQGYKVHDHNYVGPVSESVAEDLTEAPGDFGLGANYRAVPDAEMQDFLDRSKTKTKTKRDKFDYPYVHGSNIEVKDEGGKSYDSEALKKSIMIRPKSILGQNAKMQHSETGDEAIYDIGLPALKGLAVNEKTGEFVIVDTCPGAGACQTYCYAMKGSYVMFKAVSMGLARMLNFLLNDPEGFAAQLNQEIATAKAKLAKKNAKMTIRWHDAGDFFSSEYLAMAYSVAEANPDVGFYAYTKMASAAQAERPKNFNMNFSQGALRSQEKKVDLVRTKHSKVVPKDMFFDLIARDGNNLKKDAKGRMQFATPENLEGFKDRLAQKYHIDKDSILTYDQMMKTPVGDTPKWNVIVMPGDGDNSANRNDVVGSYLLFH